MERVLIGLARVQICPGTGQNQIGRTDESFEVVNRRRIATARMCSRRVGSRRRAFNWTRKEEVGLNAESGEDRFIHVRNRIWRRTQFSSIARLFMLVVIRESS